MAKISEIDGRSLYLAFLAGSQKILANQKHMNAINVFPVPDGDTGSNLAATVNHVLDHTAPHRSLKKTADTIAAAALDGARGNSGIILAQFLFGFSERLGSEASVNVGRFSQILKGAYQYAVEAIEKPVEGTLITVLRDWVARIDKMKERSDDFVQVMNQSLRAAQASLLRTTQQLEVLRINRVVDAGAQGFVYFLEGVWEAFKDNTWRRLRPSRLQVEKIDERHVTGDLSTRFCTEGVVEGENLDISSIRKKLSDLGESLVTAGSTRKTRIHIHTDRPAEVFFYLKDLGTVKHPKVDDMLRQYQTIHDRKYPIALVTDSVCDLPEEIFERFRIHRIPIHIHFGDNHFLDKSSMTPDQFYRLLDEWPDYPTTSHPGMGEFSSLYSRLAAHYDSIISIHMSRKLSGTWNAGTQAARSVGDQTGKQITVVDSRHLSGSLGLLVLRGAEAIAAGGSHDEVVREVEDHRESAVILVSVTTLKYMVKGGRVSPMKGVLANLLNLKPIVSLNREGESVLFDKAFSQKGSMKKILSILRKRSAGRQIWKYSLLHAHDTERAFWFSKKLEAALGRPPEFVVDISPAVGISAGLGAVAVAFVMGKS